MSENKLKKPPPPPPPPPPVGGFHISAPGLYLRKTSVILTHYHNYVEIMLL